MPNGLVALGGLLMIALIYLIMGKYDSKKDPNETEDGKVINLDEHEHRIGQDDDYPPLRKTQNN